jgi:retinol dehydrogenase-13
VEKRLAVVTGATGAIGRAIAEKLAVAGWELVLPVRDPRRAKKLPGTIVECDLSRRESIDRFARGISRPVHALVNNAAECPQRREETPDGIERQLATNVLGYLWMTLALEQALVRARPSRVIFVASYWAGGLDLADLEFRRRRYDNNAAYRQSKQANRMLASALAEPFSAHGIWVGSCHPGDVNSKLSNALGFGGSESPDEGADTPSWLVTAEDPGPSGAYYADRRAQTCAFSRDRAGVEALHRALVAY